MHGSTGSDWRPAHQPVVLSVTCRLKDMSSLRCSEAMSTEELRKEGLAGLCSEDGNVAQLLDEAAQRGALDVHLAVLVRVEVLEDEGDSEDDYDSEDGCYGGFYGGDERRMPASPRVVERTQQLQDWTRLDGQPSKGMRPLSLDEDLKEEVLQVRSLQGGMPDQKCLGACDGPTPSSTCMHLGFWCRKFLGGLHALRAPVPPCGNPKDDVKIRGFLQEAGGDHWESMSCCDESVYDRKR